MSGLLCGIDGIVCYLDDVVVVGSSSDDLAIKLRAVFDRMRDAGLKLRREKCMFYVPSIRFLGFDIDADGIHPLHKKYTFSEK